MCNKPKCSFSPTSHSRSFGAQCTYLTFLFTLAYHPRGNSFFFEPFADTSTHKELGFSANEAQVDAVLADFPPWDCMYPEDRKAMIGDMKARTVTGGGLIQAEDDPRCPLFVILKGTVDILEPVNECCNAAVVHNSAPIGSGQRFGAVW